MRTLSKIIGAVAALSVAACGSLEEQRETVVSQPEAVDPYSVMAVTVHDGEFAKIQQFTTPKGVSVWLVEEPSIPILSLRMAWQNGSTLDPDGIEGLTHAMTYHMNEGAGDLDSQTFFKRMEELNMSFWCSTGTDNTYCNSSMLTDNAEASFDVIASAYAAPRFDDGPFERFLREQEVSLNTREADAGYLAHRAIRAALYPDHPYAREVSAESLAAITQAGMQAQKAKIMVREGMLVTAVGAISPDELAALVDRAVDGLPEIGTGMDIPDVTMATPPVEPIVVDLPQPQSLVRFTAPAMPRDDPDFYTAVVANYSFGGGGFESRLMKELRVAKGLTYGVGTGVSAEQHIQTWYGSGQTKNESAGEFIQGIKNQMSLIIEEGMSAEELADAKAYLTGSYPLGFDSNSKIAGNMMGVRLDGLPVDFFDKRNAMVEAVTLEDANRVLRTYLQPDNFTFVVVGQPEGLEE